MRVLLVAAVLVTAALSAPQQTGILEYSYKVVHIFPHDGTAFTEGLFYRDGFLYEGTGLPGKSSVRKVKLDTGQVVQQHDLTTPYFGEGIVAWKNRLLELTWTSQTGFFYDLVTLQQQGTFHYRGEGWSMTTDGKRIFMDDGTPNIRIWNPDTLQQVGTIKVTADGKPVQNLNELEWVNGELYANVWHTDRIARIDPRSGRVVGWIDLTGLLPQSDVLSGPEGAEQVLNGIAYDAKRKRLFVTGKYWPKLFEIQVVPALQ